MNELFKDVEEGEIKIKDISQFYIDFDTADLTELSKQ